MRSRLRPRLALLFALAIAPAAALPGCTCVMTTSPGGAVPPGEAMPPPASPYLAVGSFEWCWDRRAVSDYPLLFSADFGLTCDSTADAWDRTAELASFRHMIDGGASSGTPIVDDIALDVFDEVTTDDPRAGHPGTWHRMVMSRFRLRISGRVLRPETLSGTADFYLVRGDSAAIPADLVARGITPDSTRWFISRMAVTRAPDSPSPTTWCELRERYR